MGRRAYETEEQRKEAQREAVRRYRAKDVGKTRSRQLVENMTPEQRMHRRAQKNAASKRYHERNKEQINSKRREYTATVEAKTKRQIYRQNLRDDILIKYGAQCACCGETDPHYLQIDHVSGNGAHERERIGQSNEVLYRYLRDTPFDPSYQLLCGSCNFAKGTGDQCPHQEFSIWSLLG